MAISPWQAMGVEAYVRTTPGLDLGHSMVLVAPYEPPVGYVLTKDNFPSIRDRVAFERLPLQPHMHDHFLGAFLACRGGAGRGDTHLDILAPRNPIDALPVFARHLLGRDRSRITWVVIDEGIASYNYQVLGSGATVAAPAVGLRPRLLARLRKRMEPWVRSHPWQTRYVFRLDPDGRWSSSPDLAPLYLDQLRGVGQRLPEARVHPWALFVSDPGYISGFYGLEGQRQLTTAIADGLVAKGYRVLIKPHPSEPPALYNHLTEPRVTLADSLTPAEALAAQLSSRDVVVGVTSGALYTIPLLTGVRTYSAVTLASRIVPPVPGSAYDQSTAEFCSLVLPFLAGPFEEVPDCSVGAAIVP